MNREEIEAMRERVSCASVLERAGFKLDGPESTKRAMKYRRGSEIVIVTHEGRGWFNPLGEDKGDVFSLAMALDGISFPVAIEEIAPLVGVQPSLPVWRKPHRNESAQSLNQRWKSRRVPGPGFASWRYLRCVRSLPDETLYHAIRHGVLREGPFGSMWACHTNDVGVVVGWEERGPEWRGFATRGTKVLFRLGSPDANRLCVTEAAIDAMSLAAIEGLREGTLYLSTGGGWSPATEGALISLASRTGTQLVAATDANPQGENFADRLRAIAERADCDWQRLSPSADDWNEALRKWENQKKEDGEEKNGVPHAHRPGQGRLRPAKAGP